MPKITIITKDDYRGYEEWYVPHYKCPGCGDDHIMSDFQFCPMCGIPIKVDDPNVDDDDRTR